MNFRAAQSLPSLRLRLSPAARPGRLPSSLLPTRPPSESSLVRRPPFRPLTSHTTGGRGPCPLGTATAGKAKDGQRAEPHWPPRRRQWRGENIHLQAWEGPPRGETKSNSKRFPRTDSLSSAPLRSGGATASGKQDHSVNGGRHPGSGQRGTRDVGLAQNPVSRGLASWDMRHARSRRLLDGECVSAQGPAGRRDPGVTWVRRAGHTGCAWQANGRQAGALLGARGRRWPSCSC